MQCLGAGVKRIQHPIAGVLTLEHTTFSVEASNGLNMIVFTPASPADAREIAWLLSRKSQARILENADNSGTLAIES
jgi:hypothetical protein